MTEQDEHIKRLMRKALDEAFMAQIAHLYKSWLSNPKDLQVAQGRAAVGADNAISVYRAAVLVVDDWDG